MKASTLFFAALAVSSLTLTSCEKDSLTENIRLDESNRIINTEVSTRSLKGDPFEFNEVVMLTADDATGDSDKVGSAGSRSGKGDPDSFGKSQPNLAILGFGDSRIQNWGSWYVEVDLIYDPDNNAVTGTLSFTYPDYGDEVRFAVSGQPALIVDRDDNSENLEMQLAIIQGTGRFENKAFEGSAVLPNVGSLIDGSGDLRTDLVVDGVLIDNPINKF